MSACYLAGTAVTSLLMYPYVKAGIEFAKFNVHFGDITKDAKRACGYIAKDGNVADFAKTLAETPMQDLNFGDEPTTGCIFLLKK